MRVVTASEMREIDRKTIEEYGVASLDLMERAGVGAAHVVSRSGIERGKDVVIVCGKGNNGGDGFVAGRYLKEWGADVTCWVIGERDELTSDTLRNLVTAEDAGVAIERFTTGESESKLSGELETATCAVDALLGTGSKGKLRDPIRRISRILNESAKRVFALDIPTGMNADSGAIDPDCIRSFMTITFGFPKRGMYSLPGRDLCGDITVVDLGYPEETVEVATRVLLWEEIRNMLPLRDPRGHKGTFGHALVVAGSPGMTGAACLSAEAALRSGAGLVKLLVPESMAAICATKLTEVMVYGMPESARGTLSPDSVATALPFLEKADALLLGPGLSSEAPAKEFVKQLLPQVEKPVVIDADALNALEDDAAGALSSMTAVEKIITPHPGELGRLMGRKAQDLANDSVGAARAAASQFDCDVIFKAAPAVVASPDGSLDLCSLGSDGMATAGSGDVLAGLIVGLLAQGYEAARASRVGVMVHARAGDICRGELSRRGMIAGDMIRCVPYAWRELEAEPRDEDEAEEEGE